jgi:pyruvate,water dikinase
MDFRALPPHQLMQLYRDMEEQLLWQWKTPIINDFFVMIFYGSLKRRCRQWCGDDSGSLQNDLICGEGGIESTQPTRLLLTMAKQLKADAALAADFLATPSRELAARVAHDPRYTALRPLVATYLDRYGFRCMSELKLEEPSLRDEPAFLFQVVQNYLQLKDEAALDPVAKEAHEQQLRAAAEARAAVALRGHPLRRLIFRQVLRNARLGVKNRENLRFARTRIYGLLRELLNALGHHFAQEGLLDSPRDLYLLTMDEVWDYVKGTAVTTDLRGLVALRRREWDGYRQTPPPDDHFETYGLAYHRNQLRNWAPPPTAADLLPGQLRGVGCCPGTVRGKVRVVRHPSDDLTLNGEILVAGRTDPGWVPLYPAVSGLLIERGSILSHSAIVAREMGIPTIVGIPNLLDTLHDGQEVELNGQTGLVTVLTP